MCSSSQRTSFFVLYIVAIFQTLFFFAVGILLFVNLSRKQNVSIFEIDMFCLGLDFRIILARGG